MKNHKKTFIGSIIAFVVGTSCCWMSTLAIWFGGAAFITVTLKWVESFQVLIIILSLILALASGYFYLNKVEE